MKHLLIILSILLLSSPVIGDNHKGEVENGEPKGKGIETFPNGEKYVGEFKDGEFHGQGTFI